MATSFEWKIIHLYHNRLQWFDNTLILMQKLLGKVADSADTQAIGLPDDHRAVGILVYGIYRFINHRYCFGKDQ